MEDTIRKLAELMNNQNGEDSESPLFMNAMRDSLGAAPQTDALPQPNGGLQGSALDEAIDRNPGPMATTGFNPSNPGPLDIRSASLFDRNSAQMNNQLAKGNLAPEQSAVRQLAATGKGAVDSPAALQAKQPTAQPALPNSGYGDSLNDSALAKAQEGANMSRLIGMLGNAGSTIGAAFSRGAAKPVEIGNDLIKNADQGTKDILTRRDAADKDVSRQKNLIDLSNDKDKNDPNSEVSKLGRAIAVKLSQATGIKLGGMENASWSSLEKALPGLERYAGLMESANARKEAAAERKDSKTKESAEKQFLKFGESLDVNRARAGATGKVADKLNAAERVEGLFKQFPDGNVPRTQTRELATSVAALLSSGGTGAAVSQINELVPHSLMGNAAGIAEWVTNQPVGAGQQAFMKLLAETAQREKEIAMNQLKRDRLAKIPAFEHLQKVDPDRFNNILTNTGQIKPEEYDQYKKGDRIDVTGGLNKMTSGKSTTSSDTPKGMIKVISPEGKEGMIPEANLKKALERGFKQVQ